ncbi:MAG: alpha/beta fold hydrolase [Deltaproteobacteria bacterium]|nr:alpha/beta fold hydrolase [Deltaproteobacteria bacterium]
MPTIRANGLNIAYHEQGDGAPLVLIRGYANSGALWYDQAPDLSAHFRVIAMDNRGTGDSDKPEAPYTIADMAGDVIGIVERLDLGAAHLLGISMGGMIAMQAALDAPQTVRSLVLGCTTCEGTRGFNPDPKVAEMFKTLPELSDEDNVRRSVPVLFSDKTIRERPEICDRYVRESLKYRPPMSTFVNQMKAIARFDLCDRLSEIVQPTFILHGEGDLLIRPDMARRLHEAIPGSKLELMRGLGHLFFMEEAASFNRSVIEFLKGL